MEKIALGDTKVEIIIENKNGRVGGGESYPLLLHSPPRPFYLLILV